MSVTYRLTVDLAFVRTGLRRYRRQRPHRIRRLILLWLGPVLIAGAWLHAKFTGAPWEELLEYMLIGGAIGGAASTLLARVVLVRLLKRNPEYGTDVTIHLDDEGLVASGAHTQAKIDWPGITRAARLPDGLMLIRGRIFRWLPDAALQDSTPEQATALVRSKTALLDVV